MKIIRLYAPTGILTLLLTMLLVLFGGTPHAISETNISEIKKTAEQGDAKAQYQLGIKYANGKDVPKDEKEAVNWLTKAAEQGNIDAQNRLGSMYSDGDIVPQDGKQAVNWYLKAAEQGSQTAQFYLGNIYLQGEIVPQDSQKCIYWFTKAAEQKFSGSSQLILAAIYDEGKITPQNDRKAFYWYQKAAESGFAYAQLKIGHMYDVGIGVPTNEEQAANWYRKAAEQGDADAQYRLGLKYAIGQGVPYDNVYAYAWLSLAATQGKKDAPEMRDSAAKTLSYEQRSKAQSLAAELQGKIDAQAPPTKEAPPTDKPVVANTFPAPGSTSETPPPANTEDKMDFSSLNAIYDPPNSEPQQEKSGIDIALNVIGILFIIGVCYAVYMATTEKAKVRPLQSSDTGQTASDPEGESYHQAGGTTPSPLMVVCEKCSHAFSKRASQCPKCKAPRIACCLVCNNNIATDCEFCPECGDPNPFGNTLDGVLAPPPKLSPAISLAWQRFWARSIDYASFLVAFNIIVALLSMNGPMVSDNVIIELATLFILSLVFLILYEATWLSAAATTPGKALFSIKVYTKQGENLSFVQAFWRSFSALASGFAFLIFFPLIPMFAMWKSYKEIKNTGSASWDKKEGYEIIHQPVGSPRLWSGVILGLVAVVTITLIATVGKQMNKEMMREQLHQKYNIHRK